MGDNYFLPSDLYQSLYNDLNEADEELASMFADFFEVYHASNGDFYRVKDYNKYLAWLERIFDVAPEDFLAWDLDVQMQSTQGGGQQPR